jgi:ketosteroid isomerase-like protein
MRTSVILKVLVICVLSTIFSGCATGPSDEEVISKAMVGWKAAFHAKDVDKMMGEYSEDYAGQNGEGKEAVREFLVYMKNEGEFENAKMNTDETEIEIEGEKATVGPILYTGNWGEVRFIRELKKEEDNVWRVVRVREAY